MKRRHWAGLVLSPGDAAFVGADGGRLVIDGAGEAFVASVSG